MVVWQSGGSAGTDDQASSIQGQRFASDGTRKGAEFQVNTYVTGGQGETAVAVADEGNFLVTWKTSGPPESDPYSSGIRGQRFASDGTPSGVEFQVNAYTTGGQSFAGGAAGPGGDFIIVWESTPGSDDPVFSIRTQRFASDGSRRGAEFQVNSYTTGWQNVPAIAASAAGDFVVAWRSNGAPFDAESSYSIQAQRYAPPRDYGDAPDPTFPTLLASNGARHNVEGSNVWLGTSIDEDADGRPTSAAAGDDGDGIDDEDGVTVTSALAPGATATLDVVASTAAFLDAWIDFNGDGDWNDAGENVFNAEPLDSGTNGLSFPVPADALEGSTTARFRLSSAGGLSSDGVALDGEVEDHRVTIGSTPLPAVMALPNPGTVLTDTTVTFQWTSGAGVLEYWFQVGTTKPGSRELFNGSTGLSQAQTVAGISRNGSTIFVRLWSRLPDGWVYGDCTYTAPSGAGGAGAASIISPTPGSTLPLGPVTFQWDPGSGTQFHLQVGVTKPGSREIFNHNVGSATSQTVSGIPGGGITIYVRLWSLVSDKWQRKDVVYTAPDGRAEIYSPTPGSKLISKGVTFLWTVGAGATSYWLQVGTTKPGSREVFNGAVSGTTQRVGGLPINGAPVYVRLWTRIGGKWYANDYTYTAWEPS